MRGPRCLPMDNSPLCDWSRLSDTTLDLFIYSTINNLSLNRYIWGRFGEPSRTLCPLFFSECPLFFSECSRNVMSDKQNQSCPVNTTADEGQDADAVFEAFLASFPTATPLLTTSAIPLCASRLRDLPSLPQSWAPESDASRFVEVTEDCNESVTPGCSEGPTVIQGRKISVPEKRYFLSVLRGTL